jgi:hypothetical protein
VVLVDHPFEGAATAKAVFIEFDVGASKHAHRGPLLCKKSA